MNENPYSRQNQSKYNKHRVLLDVSLFILDMLDPKKIKSKYLEDDVVLEIPGALAVMIEDAWVGNPLLWQFIYAYLLHFRNHHQGSSNESIQKIVKANEEELRKMISDIILSLFNEIAPYISSSTMADRQYVGGERSISAPIMRYEPMIDLSSDERYKLQIAYVNELNISSNPLFDVYFLQVLHAQTVGYTATAQIKREFLSVGRGTNASLKKWIGRSIAYPNKYGNKSSTRTLESSAEMYSKDRKKIDNEEIHHIFNNARESLNWLVRSFFRPKWIPVVLAATDVLVDIATSVAQAGAITPENMILVFVSFASAELIGRSIDPESGLDLRTRLLFFSAGILIMICVFLVYLTLRDDPECEDNCSPVEMTTQTQTPFAQELLSQNTLTATFSQTSAVSFTQTILPITPTFTLRTYP